MTTLDIEVVNLKKVSAMGNLKAFADVKLAGTLIIKGFSVMDGKNGLFASLPKQPSKDGKWLETLQPLNEPFKRQMLDKVLEAYDREIEERIEK